MSNETKLKKNIGKDGKPTHIGAPLKIEYSREIWLEICERIASGESLRQIHESDSKKFPSHQLLLRWVDAAIDVEEDHPLYGLPDQYTRAMLARATMHGDQVLEIADDPFTPYWREKIEKCYEEDGNPKMVAVLLRGMLQHAHMRIEARKWHSARMDPKRWHLRSDSGNDGKSADEAAVQITGGLPDEGSA